MNLFKTTALALVLGAFGLAHSAGDEARAEAQASSRVAKTISQLHDEIGTIVNNPGASKRKMEAIAALLAAESEDYEFTAVSSIPNAGNLVGTKDVKEFLTQLNLVSKNPAPVEEEEEKQSQGTASEEEEEEEEGEGSQGSASEEEGDAEEEGPHKSAPASDAEDEGEPSEALLRNQIAMLKAAAKKLTAEKAEADEAVLALQEKERKLRQNVDKLEAALEKEKASNIATNATLGAQLAGEKAKLEQTEAALAKAQKAEEVARAALATVKASSKKTVDTLTAEREAVRTTLHATEDTLAAERVRLEDVTAALTTAQQKAERAEAALKEAQQGAQTAIVELTNERDTLRTSLQEKTTALQELQADVERRKVNDTAKAEEFKAAQEKVAELTQRLAAAEQLLTAQVHEHAELLAQKEAEVRAQFVGSVPVAEVQQLRADLAEMDAEIQEKSRVNLAATQILKDLKRVLADGFKKGESAKFLTRIQTLLGAE